MKTRDRLFIGVVLLLGVISVRLGIWQLHRRQERIALNSEIETRLSQPVIDFPDNLLAPQDFEFQHVRLEGRFDAMHELLLRNRSFEDQPGVHLITPLIGTAGDVAVLVDRGWLPHSATEKEDLPELVIPETITIEGILRLSMPEPSLSFLADPTRGPGEPAIFEWQVVNIDRIQSQIPYALQPVYIELSEPPSGNQTYPIPDPEIDLSQGPHLSYAIQWFAFSGIAFVGSFYFWRRKSLSEKEG